MRDMREMKNACQIVALIATSNDRNSLLFNRALPSVFRQTRRPDAIVVVDDNDEERVSCEIAKRIELCRGRFPNIFYVRNSRTRHMSGTGAWNTGISFVAKEFGEESYVGILDDDDEWLDSHLSVCSSLICGKSGDAANAVFAWLRRDDCRLDLKFSARHMRPESFLAGNPGIQGSNMFFRIGALTRINGFDESLASCTDRDLMTRFLLEFGSRSVRIVNQVTVLHHSGPGTVTSDGKAKKLGLDLFYKKHLGKFDSETLGSSLSRAERLFSYPNGTTVRRAFRDEITRRSNEVIAIGVMVHDDAKTIKRCLMSILRQKGLTRRVEIVVQDDDSHDNWEMEVKELLDQRKLTMTIRRVKIGNVAKARTELNRYIVEQIPNVALIGRLDADDEFANENALSGIERAYDMSGGADLVLGGNFLRAGALGRKLRRVNRADRRLCERVYLLERLRKMACGVKTAELPSCNMFLSPHAVVPYPALQSAEDHALLVHYLLCADRYNVVFAEDCLPVIYSLGGNVTAGNKRRRTYLESRKELYKEAMIHVGQSDAY